MSSQTSLIILNRNNSKIGSSYRSSTANTSRFTTWNGSRPGLHNVAFPDEMNGTSEPRSDACVDMVRFKSFKTKVY